MWIVIGYLLSITTLKIHGALRGLFLSFLVLFPNLFIISWDDPFKLVPIVVMTGILGAIAGYVYQKIVR
jgi:succinate-acetate transporter protein